MKVLVVGATGATGQAIATQAIEAGHDVIALVRSAVKASSLLPLETRVVEGDVRDDAAVRRALEGCDAVISALGSRRPTLFRKVTLLSEGTKAIVEGMRHRNVGRLVCSTGVGAGDSRGHGGFVYDRLILPIVLRTMYADKDRQETIVRKSGFDWTLVRPTMLNDKPAAGQVRALTDLTGFHGGGIPRSDVAAFAVAEATAKRWVRRAVTITAG